MVSHIEDNNCGCCSIIYDSYDDYIKHHPFCDGAAFVNYHDENDGESSIVFYVPCKDTYYDKWFDFNFYPNCGKPITH